MEEWGEGGRRTSSFGKEDEWEATSYGDKLGRSLADVRAICASTARDNAEPIETTIQAGDTVFSAVGCR